MAYNDLFSLFSSATVAGEVGVVVVVVLVLAAVFFNDCLCCCCVVLPVCALNGG